LFKKGSVGEKETGTCPPGQTRRDTIRERERKRRMGRLARSLLYETAIVPYKTPAKEEGERALGPDRAKNGMGNLKRKYR